MSYDTLETKVKDMHMAKARQMFGYRCYLVCGKVFCGFDNKSNYRIIVRLPKERQVVAIKNLAIRPFSHGAKKGWAEMDARLVPAHIAIKWISEGYDYAQRLAGKA